MANKKEINEIIKMINGCITTHTMIDYSTHGTRELIERIHELEKELKTTLKK